MANSVQTKWRIVYYNDYGREEKDRERNYKGFYHNAVQIYNPFLKKNIKIIPDSRINIRDNKKKIQDKDTLFNANTAMEKTLRVIFETYKVEILKIEIKIAEEINKGNNSITLTNFMHINNESDHKKFKYFYDNLGYKFEYLEENKSLIITW